MFNLERTLLRGESRQFPIHKHSAVVCLGENGVALNISSRGESEHVYVARYVLPDEYRQHAQHYGPTYEFPVADDSRIVLEPNEELRVNRTEGIRIQREDIPNIGKVAILSGGVLPEIIRGDSTISAPRHLSLHVDEDWNVTVLDQSTRGTRFELTTYTD